jgi:hypothetical protein
MLYRTTWERLKHLKGLPVDACSSPVRNGMTSIEALFGSLTYRAIESEKCDDVVGLKASSRPKIFAWQIFARPSWRTIAERTRRPCKSTVPSVTDTEGLHGSQTPLLISDCTHTMALTRLPQT